MLLETVSVLRVCLLVEATYFSYVVVGVGDGVRFWMVSKKLWLGEISGDELMIFFIGNSCDINPG